MDRHESLRQIPFLRDLPDAAIAALAALVRDDRFAPGAVVFREGQPHPDFHLVLEGHVRLDMAVPRRGRIPILTVGPGEVLAWSALIGTGAMTATGIALEPVRTLAFDGEQLRQLCRQQPDVGYHVMQRLARALSQRLLSTRLQLLDLFLEHVPTLGDELAVSGPVDSEC